MPHNILQTFQVHASVCHIGAEGVTHDVWRDRRQIFFVSFAVFPGGAAHVVFHIETYHEIAVSVQSQKFGAAAHDQLPLGHRSALHHVPHVFIHLVCHGDVALTAGGLSLPHMVRAALFFDQLLADEDFAVLEVQILNGQPAELADPHAGAEQNVEHIAVPAVVGIFLDKFHEGPLMLRRQRLPLFRIVDQHAHQAEGEKIFADDVVVIGHLEGRLDHASNAANRAVTPAFFLQLHEPELGIRGADGGDQAAAEFSLCNNFSTVL